MKIKRNDRVLVAGKTGSGKTWFAGKMLSGVDRLVVIDPKANLTDWNLIEPSKSDWSKFDRGSNGRFRILPPVLDDPESWYEGLFETLYNIGDLILYIDEAYAVAPPGTKPGKWLSALYTRGREFGIGVWAATQRPTWIPLFLISEADWVVCFRLNLPEDRSRISKIVGEQAIEPIPDEHGFWLYRVGSEEATYFQTSVLKPEKGV